MEYKGFTAAIEFDDSVDTFTGHLTGTRDQVHFEGRTVVELRQAFQESIDGYLASIRGA